MDEMIEQDRAWEEEQDWRAEQEAAGKCPDCGAELDEWGDCEECATFVAPEEGEDGGEG